MYTSGLNPKIKELYSTIKYPVSHGTPSIYGLPFWDHTEKLAEKFQLNIVSKLRVLYSI